MTSIEVMYNKIKELQDQRTAIFDQIRPLHEKVSSLHKEITSIQENITTETMKLEQSGQERFDFLMAENGSSSDMGRYKEAEKFIRSMGLYMSGYCPFSQQKSSEVFIFKNDSVRNEQSISSIKKLVELYKPMDEDGNKKFRVFCQNYYIVFTANKTIELTGRYMFSKEFSTLEELFDYYVAHCECYDTEENEND